MAVMGKMHLFAMVLFISCLFSVYAENEEERTGFGLQAEIFRKVEEETVETQDGTFMMTDYTPTPGDLFMLTITAAGIRADGTLSPPQKYTIRLKEDYTLNIPFIGSVNARDKTLFELQANITGQIRKLMPVQYVEFLLEAPAQFQVFVYGGVQKPGYVVATAMDRVTTAITAAEGFKAGGSYRQIKLFRDNRAIVLDISRYYENAEFSSNPTLRPGDRVFVPKADVVVTITGEIFYPGVYELLPEETLRTLINMAGGLTTRAAKSKIEISRVDHNGDKKTFMVNFDEAKTVSLQMGDTVHIPSTLENPEIITVEGAVFGEKTSADQPVKVPQSPLRIDIPFYRGITLLSALDTVGGPSPLAEAEKGYILRGEEEEKITPDIVRLWKTRNQKLNIELLPGDKIVIPMKKMQIFVTGQVSNPGAYNYVKDYKVSDYILLAGGIREPTGDSEGIYLITGVGTKKKLDPEDDVKAGDQIYVSQKLQVYVGGEVDNPGAFTHSPELTVNDYILMAGGISENTGNPRGIFLVDELGNREKVKVQDRVEPGKLIYVSKKFLFKSDQFVQNALIATGWVASIFGVVQLIFNIIDFVEEKTAPAQ